LVDLARDTAENVGDEALILAQHGITIVSRDRYAGALLAEKNHHDMVIMDDGYQNRSLAHDVKLLVIDNIMGFGNGLRIPAGPLRENIQHGLARAHGVIHIRDHDTAAQALNPCPPCPVISARRIISLPENVHDTDRLIAFCGLAYPDKFYQSLKNLNVIETHSYADHYSYSSQDLKFLMTRADEKKARLITTQKDQMRISKDFLEQILIVNMRIEFDEPDLLKQIISQRCQ
jgi:tetraacyldisaccharide 4'-kinase